VYDIWGNWNPTFVKDSALLLGFNLDFGYNSASGPPVPPASPGVMGALAPGVSPIDSNTYWGGALYAQYKFSKVFSLAGRFEYIHSDAALYPKFGTGSFGGYTVNSGGFLINTPPQNDFSYTLTASFNVWDNLLTRVEYRLDALSGDSTPVGHGEQLQHEISLNAVYSF